MHFSQQLILTAFATAVNAIHAEEAGVVDWHKQLVGAPISPPVFHRVHNGQTTTSVILTATTSNVLAAINPVTGDLAWRHVFDPADPILTFSKHEKVVASLSGAGGANLRVFDALNGHLIHEKRLHDPQLGLLTQPANLGSFISFSPESDIAILTNGRQVRLIDGKSFEEKWIWESTDDTETLMYSKVHATKDAIYAIGLEKETKGFTLQLTSLSYSAGSLLSFLDLATSVNGPEGIHVLTFPHPTPVNPRLIWVSNGIVASISLTPTLSMKNMSLKGKRNGEVINVNLLGQGVVVINDEDGHGRVWKMAPDGGSVKSAHNFGAGGKARGGGDVWSGGFDRHGYPYVVRVYWSAVFKAATMDVWAGHLADGKGLASGFTFPFDTNAHGIISHMAIDATSPSPFQILSRMVLTTTTGSVQLWQQDQMQWNREEGLAGIEVAQFVELPQKATIVSSTYSNETFVARILRQAEEAKDFPHYLATFARRFLSGTPTPSAATRLPLNVTALERDTFGFRQLIIAATTHGKLYALDSASGEVVWARVLGHGWAGKEAIGASVKPVRLDIVKDAADGEGRTEVALTTQRQAANGLVDTVVFHVDAFTGADVSILSDAKTQQGVLQGVDVVPGPLVETFYLRNGTNMVVLLVDEFLRVHLYPNTPSTQAFFASNAPSLYFPLLGSTSSSVPRVLGHQLVHNPEHSADQYVAHSVWTMSLPEGERVQSIVKQATGPVASYGKVLGNRTTLYKWLNPRAFIVLTDATNAAPLTKGEYGGCGIYVVDAAKGSVVYEARVRAQPRACDVKASLMENWLVYHYYHDDGQEKGYRMVSVELYEGEGVDQRMGSSDISAFVKDNVNVTAYEQSYIFPYGVTALTTTKTKLGITAKNLIVATNNNRIHSIPRRLLDPRRPNRKPTAEEVEEQLISYDPMLPNDPKLVLSHNYNVANVREIVTAPALLESTSLVLAYGNLDLFFTRVAPSKTFDVLSSGFNKLQLVLTIAALGLGIVITKPMVRRKKLRERWYQ